MVPVGARLAELARLRLQYDESRRQVQVRTIRNSASTVPYRYLYTVPRTIPNGI
jgi:hypothetical protein